MVSRSCHACYAWTTAMPGRPGRIETAVRDHPLRTFYNVETVPRMLCPGRHRRIAVALRDNPLMVSTKCRAC
eukprot:8079433-Pyramimonas_sp.AAC.1